jgi:hexosaminidase
MKILYPLIIAVLLSCSPEEKPEIKLIPLPNQLELLEGTFTITQNTSIHCKDPLLLEATHVFQQLIKKHSGNSLTVNPGTNTDNSIEIIFQDNFPDEGYELHISTDKITIKASKPAGVFYALQTTVQLCPDKIHEPGNTSDFKLLIPACRIIDSPAFPWRGMMLDVSRHFFSKEDIKELMDYLAFHKINTLHLHLVDDQGWRVEIKKYPKLTEIGAWRVDREHLPWNSRPPQNKGEKASYGGFYTQEDIRELVDYANQRYITIVPEIEMPAHTTSSLAAYPEYSCTGGPFSVLPGGVWPITDIYCAGKEETFQFIEDILSEIMDLFPSKYIHIGGDEATRTEWEKCRFCQERMKKEKLQNTEELQGYFIKRVEKFISSRGRILIGWDEILEGGLPPGAVVMSWRGFEGGMEAARKGHHVIMSPGSHCYLDHYQGAADHEPLAIGGYTPLSKVYEFNPVPDELSLEESEFILGAQGNLWTEFVPDKKHMHYMAFPRMAALAEVLWTNTERRQTGDFFRRLEKMMERYDKTGLNYAKSIYTVQIKSSFERNQSLIKVQLSTEMPDTEIFYTLDGSEPTEKSLRYMAPLEISHSKQLKAQAFKNGIPKGRVVQTELKIHMAVAKKVEYLQPYSEKYPGNQEYTFTDCLRGSLNFRDGNWQAFEGNDMEVIIDLQKPETIHLLTIGCLHNAGSWIFLPDEITAWVSDDKINFRKINQLKNETALTENPHIRNYSLDMFNSVGRYLKIQVKNLGTAPAWHQAAGEKVWLFVDEILVE